MADEGFVRGVLEQPPDEVRHPGDQVADRGVDADAEPEGAERGVDRLRHAVQQLVLECHVGETPGAGAGDRVGDAPEVVAAE